jgi:hypothetical protein
MNASDTPSHCAQIFSGSSVSTRREFHAIQLRQMAIVEVDGWFASALKNSGVMRGQNVRTFRTHPTKDGTWVLLMSGKLEWRRRPR